MTLQWLALSQVVRFCQMWFVALIHVHDVLFWHQSLALVLPCSSSSPINGGALLVYRSSSHRQAVSRRPIHTPFPAPMSLTFTRPYLVSGLLLVFDYLALGVAES